MAMLSGKTVLITGAGRGLGAAYALACARNGATVVVNDIDGDIATDTVTSIKQIGGAAVAEPGDVRSPDDCDRMVQRRVEEFGRIDGLVNNAGIFRMGTVDELNDAELRLLVETNVIGTLLCGSAAARRMRAQGGGSIVNITSGAHAGIPLMSLYGATKGAVASVTYAWSEELQGTGVRVNAVSPQARTRMSAIVAEYLNKHELPQYPGTQPEPEANAPVVVYLLSDAASAVTGQTVRIEGPQLALMTHPCVLLPVLTQDQWTEDAVAEAFANDLIKRQQPVGILGMRAEIEGVPSVFWSAEETTH
ncbi:SDR family oxidoreductase [Mycobacterium sp.]|uniref:SDR family NAD(P)-dependent oxidoreductase n=1 Tax=Mycobacterium sp. TaxID=1785 RepID=UPI00120D74F7|nr:SDR family oxidoreductase [Mycobacterium sp.]TAM65113.1 MAG: SDR family oxidoreductase [Mycobacterium sp.]